MLQMTSAEHHAKAGKASAAVRWGGEFATEEWNVNPLFIPDYDGFLRLLVARHGAAYLQRPDGQPLDGVPDRVLTAQPATAPTRKVNPRQLPKGIYTGSGYDDMHLEQKPEQQGRRTQTSLRDVVLRAVRLRPMKLQEIVDVTGIRKETAKNILFRFRGTYFRNDNHKWSEIDNVAG